MNTISNLEGMLNIKIDIGLLVLLDSRRLFLNDWKEGGLFEFRLFWIYFNLFYIYIFILRMNDILLLMIGL